MAIKPPLDLAVEVVNAAGVATRWDSNASQAGNVPRGITFNTKRGDGFSDGPQISLARRIDHDYVDINLYDDVRLIGVDGSIAHEGYLAADPRTYDAGHTVSIRVAGPMLRAQRRPFSEVYVSRDMSQWGDITTTRKAALALGGSDLGKIQASADGGGLTWQVPNEALPISTEADLESAASTNVRVAKIMYRGKRTGTWTNFEAPTLYANDAIDLSGSDAYVLTLDNTIRTQALAIARRFLMLRAFTTAAVTPPAGTLQSYDLMALYGNHGLTTQPVSGDADGVFASDVIADICRRFVPKLNPSGVQATTYPIGHLVFEQAQPYDAFTQVNSFHLWELGVWENKILHYGPADLTDFDWEVRFSDSGVTIDVPGDSVEQLANGISVSYRNVMTGQTEILDPSNTPALADPNPLNPANLHGETAWTSIDLSAIPMTAADATQLGIIALAEFNQPKAAGTITVQAHIRDRQGHWQQCWKVRAGDTVAITDHPNSRPRLIGETTWDHDAKKLTIAVDNTLNRLDAIISRITTGLQAAGVS